MVKRPVSRKLVYLFFVNLIVCSMLFLTAHAFSRITRNAREQFIIDRMNLIENRVYSLEITDFNQTELQIKIYQAYSLIENVNTQLREYRASEMIREEFYTEQEEKLVTLSTILLKTIRTEFKDKTIIYFYCEPDNSECDYEGFVLSYLSNKYPDEMFIIAFDASSDHPLIKMMIRKHSVEELPFMIINDLIVRGFRNAKQMEEIIRNESVSTAA